MALDVVGVEESGIDQPIQRNRRLSLRLAGVSRRACGKDDNALHVFPCSKSGRTGTLPQHAGLIGAWRRSVRAARIYDMTGWLGRFDGRLAVP
jgi:hypothetical protein